jgi:hypothetical protein
VPEFLIALSFDNPMFEVCCLSVNACHYDNFGTIISQRFIDDDNSDSIVLKFCFGESSAIITGDASFLTENRISSHHGSGSHG